MSKERPLSEKMPKDGLCLIESTLDLRECLAEKSVALRVSARETRDETDPLPRNLLAAFTRIERPVEVFLRFTNEARVRLNGEVDMLAKIRLLRGECAIKMSEIGTILGCQDGFLTPQAHSYSDSQCAQKLKAAASVAESLAAEFESLGNEFNEAGNGEN